MEARFSVGRVLDETFGLFTKNFLPLMSLAVVVYLPLFVMNGFKPGHDDVSIEFLFALLLSLLISSLLSLVLAGAVTHAVLHHERHGEMRVGESVSASLHRFGALGVASLLVSLFVFFGTVFFVLPGIFAFCVLWVVIPVVMAEGGSTQALERSYELTKGRRLAIFGVQCVLGLLAMIVLGALTVMMMLGRSDNLLYALVGTLLAAGLGAIAAVASAVGYLLLRAEKEGALAGAPGEAGAVTRTGS